MSSPHSVPNVETIELADGVNEARGRNGWFTPARLDVQRFDREGTISISVSSARPYVDMPPVYICLDANDARRLHEALGRQLSVLNSGRGADEHE